MAKLVNVSLLHPVTLRVGDEEYSYKPGLRVMPYDHAQKLRLLRRIRSAVEEPKSAAQAVDPSFVALDTVLDEKTAELLKGAGFSNLEELSKATQDQLLAIPGIGPARYEEIQTALGRRASVDEEGE